jgi:hypothetical protein
MAALLQGVAASPRALPRDVLAAAEPPGRQHEAARGL